MSASEAEVKTIRAWVYDLPSEGKITDILPSGKPEEFPEIISFDYYETLYDLFITADLTVFDSSGKIDKAFNNCGVRQFCPVEIELNDPSLGKKWERERSVLKFTDDNCFYVNRVKNQIVQGKKKQYTLELINRDALVSIQRGVKSAWPPNESVGIDYNTVVSDIMSQYIKTKKDTSRIMEDMSESVAKVMGNNYKPYRMLDYICSKATPKATGTGSGQEETRPAGYLFHETYDEYRFPSIYRLVTEAYNLVEAHSQYSVSIVNDGNAGPKEAAYTILGYKFYDGETQTTLLEEVETKKRGKAKKIILDSQRNVVREIIKQAPQQTCFAAAADGDFTPVMYTPQTEYQIEYYNTCEENALDNQPPNPELSSLNYGALLDMLKTQTSTIRVNGNLSLSAGDHIYIDFPEIQGDGTKMVELSAKYSGQYLITKLNHKVKDIQHVYTHMEICKLVES
jgi:hypothetical protein